MDEFPLAKRVGYFATAGVGIPPASAARAVAEYVQLAVEDPRGGRGRGSGHARHIGEGHHGGGVRRWEKRRCGYELRVVRHRGGRLSLDEFKRAVDGETAAVVMSTVQ